MMTAEAQIFRLRFSAVLLKVIGNPMPFRPPDVSKPEMAAE